MQVKLPAGMRVNPRLLKLIGVAGLIIAGELALRAWETQQRLDTELQRVRGRAAVLSASNDTINWKSRTRAAEAERRDLLARLWHVPTEAQAQARLRDWLASSLQTAAVGHPSVSLLPVETPPAAAASASLPALRVRATVAFDLAPKALENALLQIEAGGQLARVDSLNVNASQRRVEMTVSVPALLRAEERR